uniref:Uncharacterized protein n=1 Tax=Onchocerca volvulus TaxID=6282 RepID=A0A8R1TW18_ONCVO
MLHKCIKRKILPIMSIVYRRLTACQCKCSCRFYPADSKLTAIASFTDQRFPPPDEIIVPFNLMNQFPRISQNPERGWQITNIWKIAFLRKMLELVRANDILEQPLDISTNQKCSNDLSLMDLAGVTDLALRRIINMAKELIFFKVMVFYQKKYAWNTSLIQKLGEKLNQLSQNLLRIYSSLGNNEMNPLLRQLFDFAQQE